ncbi:GntR family transcriptional regulator [Kineococcus rhizosphaerae]|uniref:GntR family transcriptional regulator n=1 Tax=Kineococcus rhizosphaerae TaxID=559628 RepID=A0A2T0RB36_9ACTN|nr:GntR family transcriptional regulator [Kineococcus rhizosphaerae]PRY18350.1 GntR family transcriptional regulator [Kineococcus rhizosphaerae]
MGASAERVVAQLRRDVLGGFFPPGARLTETVLVQRYGTSRVPVREALRALAGEGFVELRPNAGARVAQVPVDDLADLYAVRCVVEEITASRCARRVAAGEAAVVAELTGIVDAGFAALDAGDAVLGAELNSQFHGTVARLSGAHSMTLVLRRVSEQIQWAYATTVPQQGHRAWTEHRRIVAAIATGEEASAGRAMVEHVEASRRGFTRSVGQGVAQGVAQG